MYWYLDILYRKVWRVYDAEIRISRLSIIDTVARDACTIVCNYNRESNQEQGTNWENKGELNKESEKRNIDNMITIY